MRQIVFSQREDDPVILIIEIVAPHGRNVVLKLAFQIRGHAVVDKLRKLLDQGTLSPLVTRIGLAMRKNFLELIEDEDRIDDAVAHFAVANLELGLMKISPEAFFGFRSAAGMVAPAFQFF